MSTAGAEVGAVPLLVVEDDEAIGRPLAGALRGQGYDVLWALTAAEALQLVSHDPPALVLLDLGLPDLDGVELCRQLRLALPAAVIVVLSARADDVDVVLGLEAGADDYLTKPFRLPVLLARIRAHLRRQGSPSDAAPTAGDLLEFGSLTLDLGARQCSVDGVEVPLRPKEFELLAALAGEAGHAVSRERLMSGVWDHQDPGHARLDVAPQARRARRGPGPHRHPARLRLPLRPAGRAGPPLSPRG
jgi:DNA-binding response OmpR family regulator